MRKFVWSNNAKHTLDEWEKINPKIFHKVGELILDIQRNPFHGIGKPEPLKHYLKGCWSRRINQEHRLVYRVTEDAIHIISCKGHYD